MKKTGRNAKCPCGSGDKYKNCCMSPQRKAQKRRRLVEDSTTEAIIGISPHGIQVKKGSRYGDGHR